MEAKLTLDVINLSLARGSRVLQRGLALGAESGSVIWVRGANGIGKSTLLETIAGLRRPLAGQIVWQGQDIAQDFDNYHEVLAFIGHKNGNNPSLTAGENLKFYADFYGADGINDALSRVEIVAQRDVPVSYLSAGQQRRLAIARLLLVPRQIWILDEPTTSLDQEGARWFASLIDNHQNEGGIVIFTSHVELPLANARVFDMQTSAENYDESDDPFTAGDWQSVI